MAAATATRLLHADEIRRAGPRQAVAP